MVHKSCTKRTRVTGARPNNLVSTPFIAPTHAGAESSARSSSFVLPRALAELVEGGLELGEADNRWGGVY